MPIDDDRLTSAASFVARLFTLSRSSPRSWRRADAISNSAGIEGERLERAIADAVRAGLVDRRVDDGSLVMLTSSGRALAEARELTVRP